VDRTDPHKKWDQKQGASHDDFALRRWRRPTTRRRAGDCANTSFEDQREQLERITAAGFPESAIVTSAPTDAAYRTVYFGFGLEGISTPVARNAVMGRVMDYLLR
jgi:hypothetical protein